jgi:hypothetical protein
MPRKKKVQVENNPDLVRDTSTNAIINTNSSAYEARRAQIVAAKTQQETDKQQRQDIDQLKTDMIEIKKMLEKLLGGK